MGVGAKGGVGVEIGFGATGGDGVPGGDIPERGGDGLHAGKKLDAADNGGTEKGASPKYRPPVSGTPPGDQADGGGVEMEICLQTLATSCKTSV